MGDFRFWGYKEVFGDKMRFFGDKKRFFGTNEFFIRGEQITVVVSKRECPYMDQRSRPAASDVPPPPHNVPISGTPECL